MLKSSKVKGVYERADRQAWQVRVRRKDASGTVQRIQRWFRYDKNARPTDPHGRTTARQLAEAFASAEVAALRIERRTAPETLRAQTLGLWLDAYEASGYGVKPGEEAKKGEEVERSRLRVLRARFPALLARPVTELSAADFGSDGLAGQMARSVEKGGEGLAAGTIKRYFTVLSSIWAQYGKKKYGLDRPWDTRDDLPHDDDSRERVLSADEFDRILTALKGADKSTLAAIVFLRWTAARRGEAAKLVWSDLTKSGDTTLVLFRDTKKARRSKKQQRQVPVPPPAVRALMDLDRTSERVFDIRGDSITQAWVRACVTAKVKDARLHDLRHTRLTELANAGMTQLQLAKVSGHKDMRMLNRYYNAQGGDIAAFVAEADAKIARQAKVRSQPANNEQKMKVRR